MVFHMMAQFEGFPAELALERPVAGVDGQMRDQRRHVREALAAELAQHHIAGFELRQVEVERLVGGRSAVRGRRRRGRGRRVEQRPQRGQGQGPAQRLPVLEGLERVRQDVPGQLALVRETGAAVHARVNAPVPRSLRPDAPRAPVILLQPQKQNINFSYSTSEDLVLSISLACLRIYRPNALSYFEFRMVVRALARGRS